MPPTTAPAIDTCGLPLATFLEAQRNACPVYGKLGLESRDDALTVLRAVESRPGMHRAPWKRRLPLKARACVHCGRWHVSSQGNGRMGRRQ